MANIIGIGIAALDIVNTTNGYPVEDSEVRAIEQRTVRGGNTTNTLVVLSQFEHICQWGGTLGDDAGSQLILQDLQQNAINTHNVRIIAGKHSPTSYITLNQNNGSRTIVHYRDLPEYSFEDFSAIDFEHADWLHFEGRNVDQVLRMINFSKSRYPGLRVSLEIEKQRPDIESLFTHPDFLLFSRHYARQLGYKSAEQFLFSLPGHNNSKDQFPVSICTWGEQGAFALHQGNIVHAPAPVISNVVDTIGAGDTFNAGFINAVLQHQDITTALHHACILASKKCCQKGFAGLTES